VEWPSSIFFREEQNARLVKQTSGLHRLYAEPRWLAAHKPSREERHSRGDGQGQFYLRGMLDLLLLSTPTSARASLASKIETYMLARFDFWSWVSRLPDGFAIGVSPFSDAAAEVTYFLRDAVQCPELIGRPVAGPGLKSLDSRLYGYIVCYWLRRPAVPIPRLEMDHSGARDEGAAFAEEYYRDHADAVCLMILAHELAHISLNHLSRVVAPPTLPFVDEFPDDLRYECEADCWAFTSIVNSLKIKHMALQRGESPVAQEVRRKSTRYDYRFFVTGHCVNCAVRAFEAYFCVMRLLLRVAELVPSRGTAMRLRSIELRHEVMRKYMHSILTKGEFVADGDLSPPVPWTEGHEREQACHDWYWQHAAMHLAPRIAHEIRRQAADE
jgi:hypothetical protein